VLSFIIIYPFNSIWNDNSYETMRSELIDNNMLVIELHGLTFKPLHPSASLPHLPSTNCNTPSSNNDTSGAEQIPISLKLSCVMFQWQDNILTASFGLWSINIRLYGSKLHLLQTTTPNKPSGHLARTMTDSALREVVALSTARSWNVTMPTAPRSILLRWDMATTWTSMSGRLPLR